MKLAQENNLQQIKQIANTVKVLALESISQANSGHSGIVLSAADFLTVLFQNHLTFDPNDLDFYNRDRFIMDPGHGSALLYALMVVYGYKSLSLNDLRYFRTLNSKTPGHPESKVTAGIEFGTGPLGQGSAVSVGLALAQKHLAALINTKQEEILNNYTYCLISDGAFEEGISYEAFSLAAKYKLNRLIYLYDSNHVQLDSDTSTNTVTNKKAYFEALGFNYLYVANGHDYVAIDHAINLAKTCLDRPSVIEFNTVIGKDTIYANSFKSHGAVLNQVQIAELKDLFQMHEPVFTISKQVQINVQEFANRGFKAKQIFLEKLKKLQIQDSTKFALLQRLMQQNVMFDSSWFEEAITELSQKETLSTREIFGKLFNVILQKDPTWLVTNPDVNSSTKLCLTNNCFSDQTPNEQLVHCGVREFAALSLVNGIVSYGGIKAASACFLSFSDYNKAALRLGCINELPILSVYSHDSILVGQDGPTHQPVEQISALRLIPNHHLFRPCNIDEMYIALEFSLHSKTIPCTIITSRQNFRNLGFSKNLQAVKGGYVFLEENNPDLILLATGSEVALALDIAKELKQNYCLKTKVVSMLCTTLFDQQDITYKKQVLNLNKQDIYSLELGTTTTWYKYADHPLGLDHFGLSANENDLRAFLHFDVKSLSEQIVQIFQEVHA